jgi:hypothetical protein
MAPPATRFLTGGRTRLIGTSLGSPSGAELPNTAMFWPTGVTAGWPGTDLANYNKIKQMWTRTPDIVRVYTNNAFATTGVTSSTGQTYGMFTPDWRSIANDGAFLFISFSDDRYKITGSGGRTGWQQIANDLNAAGSNSTKTAYLNLVQNLKRWHDDGTNTATIKSIFFGTEHEPSNNANAIGSEYTAWWQAVFNFFLDNGVGFGPKPSTGHGSSYAGTWYDMIEWSAATIGAHMVNNYTNGTGSTFYPGDGFTQWVFADVYAWSGGYPDDSNPGGSSPGFTTTQGGGISRPPQAAAGFSHYSDALKPLRSPAQNPLNWYKAGTGGSRPVRLGLGEFAISEDLTRFAVSGGALTGAATHNADKHIKGDWFEGCRKWFRGEAYTVPGGHDAGNNVPADPDGLLITAPIYWNSQAAQPRWFNSQPFLPTDTTGPTTTGGTSTGTDASYSYDKFVTLVTDSIFSGSPVIHTPPTAAFIASATEGGDAGAYTFDATTVPGDGAIVSYTWNPGDGTSNVVHTSAALTDEFIYDYTTNGLFTVTLTVTDANALTSVITHQVIVNPPLSTVMDLAFISPADRVKALRTPYNNNLAQIENYITTGNGVVTIAVSGAAQTMPDARAQRFVDMTLSANCTVALPAGPIPGEILTVVVRQAASGGPYSVTWTHASSIKWPGGTANPAVSTTASTSDTFEFHCVLAGTWRAHRSWTDIR